MGGRDREGWTGSAGFSLSGPVYDLIEAVSEGVMKCIKIEVSRQYVVYARQKQAAGAAYVL